MVSGKSETSDILYWRTNTSPTLTSSLEIFTSKACPKQLMVLMNKRRLKKCFIFLEKAI